MSGDINKRLCKIDRTLRNHTLRSVPNDYLVRTHNPQLTSMDGQCVQRWERRRANATAKCAERIVGQHRSLTGIGNV